MSELFRGLHEVVEPELNCFVTDAGFISGFEKGPDEEVITTVVALTLIITTTQIDDFHSGAGFVDVA